MRLHIALDLDYDECSQLLSMSDAGSNSRNPARRELARKIRKAVDAAEVEPDADEPVYTHEIGGEG